MVPDRQPHQSPPRAGRALWIRRQRGTVSSASSASRASKDSRRYVRERPGRPQQGPRADADAAVVCRMGTEYFASWGVEAVVIGLTRLSGRSRLSLGKIMQRQQGLCAGIAGMSSLCCILYEYRVSMTTLRRGGWPPAVIGEISSKT